MYTQAVLQKFNLKVQVAWTLALRVDKKMDVDTFSLPAHELVEVDWIWNSNPWHASHLQSKHNNCSHTLKHNVTAQYTLWEWAPLGYIIYLQTKTTTTKKLPKPLFPCGLSEEGHAGVPILLLSHALMVTCAHFLGWISPLLCLAMSERCRLKGNSYCTIHRLRTSQRKHSQDQLSTRKYYQSHGCLEKYEDQEEFYLKQ